MFEEISNSGASALVTHHPTSLNKSAMEALSASSETPLLIIISAPIGSGKAEWIKATSKLPNFAPLGSPPKEHSSPINIVDNFDYLETDVRRDLKDRIVNAEGRYLISTSRPLPFDLSALHLRGQIIRLGLKELALNIQDVEKMLNNHLVDGAHRHLTTLLERTHGWKFAWRIIRSELESGASLAELADNFTGAHPSISNFVESTILSTLDAELRQFLLEIGSFSPIQVDFALEISGRKNAFALIDQASRATQFVERVGGTKAFSLHPIFRDALEDIGERELPSEASNARREAAKWFEARSDWLAAARAWHSAGDPERAFKLLTENAVELVTDRGEIFSYRALTRALPSKSAALLAPEIALGAVFSGDFAGASALLQETQQVRPPTSKTQIERREALEIVIDFGFEKFNDVLERAPTWLHSHPSAEPRFRSMAAASLFFSCHANIDPAGATRALDLLRDCLKKTKSPFLDGWFAIMSAIERRDLGKIAAAERSLETPLASGAIRPAIEIARAKLAWDIGDVARSKHLIDQHFEASLRHGTVEVALLGWETAIDLSALESGIDTALPLIAKAERWMESVHGERGRKSIKLIRAALILKAGTKRKVPDIDSEINAITRNIDLFGPGLRLKERAKLLLARQATLAGDYRLAISIVQPIIREARQQSRLPIWCEASLIYAGAVVRLGDDPDRGLRIAWNAIDLGARSGLHAIICSEHIMLAPILDDLLSRSEVIDPSNPEESQTLAGIHGLAKQSGRILAQTRTNADDMTEIEADIKLTATEQKVLELAATGASNADIAVRMMIKLSTVKWHMQNILRKLDTPSRTAAIAQARRIGILT